MTRFLLAFLFLAVSAVAAPVGNVPYSALPNCPSGGLGVTSSTGVFACNSFGTGTGTVTSMSIVSANGLAGSVANPTTTPAATLSVTISGILKGNGTAISAASAGTDYLTPSGDGSALTGLTYTQLPALSANSVLGALTATTPSGLSMPSCSGATNALKWTSGSGFGCNTIAVGTGTVTTTGSPSSGDIATFSGATSITNVAQTGSGSVVRATSPSVSGLTVTGSLTATGLVTNADLVNASTTVNGTTCILGSSCTPQAGGIIAGSTALAGTSSRILYDNGSVVSESAGLTYDGTSVVTLGVAGASVGGLALKNATSGTVNIAPVTGALGTVTLSAPARTATLATTTGSLTTNDCAKFDASGNLVASGAGCGSGSGSVTSVAQTVPGGFSISGSPVTTTGTLAIAANGTDGGVLSYTGTTTMASSGLLASNGLVLGGGAGATPKTAAGFATDGTSVLTLGVAGTSSGGLKLSGLTSGTTTVKAAATAGTTTITLPGGTTDFSATGGSNQVVKQTSSGGAFTVATLGSGDVPCAAMPALTGGVTSSAGSCATTAASVPTSALTGTITSSKTITFDSTTAVTAQTISFPIEWTSYTITQVQSAVNGGGSFTANVKIGSTSATGCSAISVSGATNTNTSCTAANTGSANDIINVVLSSPSGTVNQAYVAVVFTHTVN